MTYMWYKPNVIYNMKITVRKYYDELSQLALSEEQSVALNTSLWVYLS